ncbi:hypothetical protein H5P28_06665 [Ruficoccus amylovorans]|uniref:Cytochrome c-552/4 domain-containing protein n=1 Tax=Ruficoccus amylovorans TaxID=1804625 RepID=A0A842HF54_9BACT|nr:multiheme c-type cytochrome [Ruficoccus amylovorans]MBC2593941.1 hypothetical protein [Ruficoccus amylovorans]
MSRKKTVALFSLVAVGLVGAALWAGSALRQSPEVSAPQEPVPLRLFFTCDTSGMLTPCNCFSGQLGGLTRLSTMYMLTDADHSLKVDIGDALRGPQDYNLIEYRYILEAYAQMDYSAANLGAREAALSREDLALLASSSPVPLLSANVLDADTRRPLAAPYLVVERAGLRIGLVGVVDPQSLPDGPGEGVLVEPMELALSRVVGPLAAETDMLVLLAFADENKLSALANQFFEADVILGGDVSQSAQKLLRANQSLISYVTNQSRALGILDVSVEPGGHVSNTAHEIVLLEPNVPQAKSVLELVKTFRAEVRATDLDIDHPERAQDDLIPGVKRVAEYVGTPACLGCHQEAARIWENSRHAHAWEALVASGSDADPNCIGCHSVGFRTPSGYRREFEGRKLVNVGCESCHGPGSLHVEQRLKGGPVSFTFRPLGPGDCTKCHYGSFSRPFDFETWWPLVEHGTGNRLP